MYAAAPKLPHASQPAASSAEIAAAEDGAVPAPAEFMIPGPLRSLERMAGISQKVSPDEVMPLLSRNVFSQGFEVSTRPTEFLILLRRYMVQARELNALAANSGMTIHVSNCAEAQPLLHILGYRVRETCGEPGTLLQTDDPERAFLSIDSGFPLPELERTLQGGKPFEYAYPSSPVPVMFADSDWTMASKKNIKESSNDLIDTILTTKGSRACIGLFQNSTQRPASSCNDRLESRNFFPTPRFWIFTGESCASTAITCSCREERAQRLRGVI